MAGSAVRRTGPFTDLLTLGAVVALAGALVAVSCSSGVETIARARVSQVAIRAQVPKAVVPSARPVVKDGLALSIVTGQRSTIRWPSNDVHIRARVTNLSDCTVAFSRHTEMNYALLTNARGQSMGDLYRYLDQFQERSPGMKDLVLLGPGESLEFDSIVVLPWYEKVPPGNYSAQVLLWSPRGEWWPVQIQNLLEREGIKTWGPGLLRSAPVQVRVVATHQPGGPGQAG